MTPENLLITAMVLPLLACIACVLLPKQDNLRDGLTLVAAIALFVTVLAILDAYNAGQVVELNLWSFQPGIELAFSIGAPWPGFRPGCLQPVDYSPIFMGWATCAANKEIKHARFFACFAFAIFATMGIAFSANLLTLFLFYEFLTVSTYPLVAHKETPEAKAGARVYLGILMSTSIVFLLTAIIWTFVLTGQMDFTAGGILAGKIDDGMLAILLALFAFGIGKAALMPFHRWLPAAMVAPTPVSALLHAVAVVKAGCLLHVEDWRLYFRHR